MRLYARRMKGMLIDMKKIRTNKKTAILSVIMLFVMLFTCLSNVITSYAETSDETEELQSGSDIVSEDENKRGEFERHYLTGDGSYIAVSYSDPVNYQDENGEWIAVDNTLKSNLLTGSMTSQNEKYKVKFANKANNDKLVSIKTDDYDISWGITVSEDGESFSELNKVKGRIDVKNSNALPKTTEEATELGKAVSSAIYENVYGDFLDVRYTVTHGKIKEDVILDKKSDFQSYKVAYNIKEEFKATLKSDGSVTVEDESGEVLFIIGAPWMSDADGACSDDISVKLLISSKTLEVIYTPSSEWLSADDRAYPVTIDPDITSRRYTGNITDISAYYGYVTDLATAPTSPTMTLGADYDVFIKMSAGTNLPNNAYVLGSSLIMYGYSLTNHLPEDYSIYDLSVEIHQIDSYWNEYWFSDWSPDYDYGDYTPYSESNPMYYISYATYSYSQCVTDTYTYPAVRFELEIPEYFIYEYGSYPQYFAQYNGFKISMSYWADTSIISSENTQYPTCRPAIVTRYSYSSPGISANTMYKIKNVGSGKYLTVSDSNSNVYQSESNTDSSQVIRVTYNTANNYYRLTPFYDRNAYIGYTDDMTDYQATYKNVTTNATTNNFESWVIIPDGDYLRICSANYPQYALTSVGTVNGTPSGTTNTSGNIFVSSNNSSNAFQKWIFEECEYQGDIESSNTTLFLPINSNLYLSSPTSIASWVTSKSSVAEINENGVVTTREPGHTVITATTTSGVQYTFNLNILLPDGTYLIKGINDLYMTVDFSCDFAELDPYNNNEEDVISKMWYLEHDSNGKYSIKAIETNSYLNPQEELLNIDRRLSLDDTKALWLLEYETDSLASEAVRFRYPDNTGKYIGTTGGFDGCNVIGGDPGDNDVWSILPLSSILPRETNLNEKLVYQIVSQSGAFGMRLANETINTENNPIYNNILIDPYTPTQISEITDEENQLPSDNPPENGTCATMWRFKKVWHLGKACYKIYSMNTNYPDEYVNRNIVIGIDENGSIVTKIDNAESPIESYLWNIYRAGDGKYAFEPVLYPNQYAFDLCDIVTIQDSTNSSMLWNIAEYDGYTYFNVTTIQGRILSDNVTLYCTIPSESEWDYNVFSVDMVKIAINQWNGISSNVHLEYTEYEESDSLVTPYINLQMYGLDDKYGETSTPENNTNWDCATITLYINDGFDEMEDFLSKDCFSHLSTKTVELDNQSIELSVQQQVLISILAHEIGHALGLQHMYNAIDPYVNQKSFQALVQDGSQVTFFPHITNYDKASLINKWGE